MEDASRALKLLKPHDALLSDAAQFYIERYLKFKADKTFNTHFNDLLEKLDWKKRRDKTKASLIDRTSAFLKDFEIPKRLSSRRVCRLVFKSKIGLSGP